MTLTDALAAGLMDLFPAVQRARWPFTPEQAAAAILSDPAFREALTAALAEAVAAERARITGEFDRSGNLHFTLAAVLAIVNPEAE